VKAWGHFGWVFYIATGVLGWYGYDRFKNYYHSEDYSDLDKYALVGGDAYNYIINTNIMNGYFIFAAACLIVGTLLFVTAAIVKAIENVKEQIQVSIPLKETNE
jgi:hypothetical protein